jgi:uncharacterized protein YndB with AHSA1/START domain
MATSKNSNGHQLKEPPTVKVEMLVRKPVAEVFEAFVDPAITSKFWFTKGSGKLKAGTEVKWEWEMYHMTESVKVKEVDKNKRILVEWSAYGTPTTVEWTFTDRPDGTTFVGITETGFSGTGDEIVGQATGSTEGFTLVLAGVKAFLEHDVRLNLVGDRFPDGIGEH